MVFLSMVPLKIRLTEGDREGQEKAELSWEIEWSVRSLVQRWRLSSTTSVGLQSARRPSLTSLQVSTGFLEGIVRGYKAGLLTQGHYANLTQCETLEGVSVCSQEPILRPHLSSIDFRTQLSTTDYGNFLANEPSPISTSTIAEKATQVLVDQFNFLRTNAVEPLSKFFDYITYAFVNSLATTLL